MIGDTSYDIGMARNAGTSAIGVAWGYHSADELRQAGAHQIAARPQDILSILEDMA
jgi:phosphoglycolate phosphatase